MSFLRIPPLVHLPSVTAAKAQKETSAQAAVAAQQQQQTALVELEDKNGPLNFVGRAILSTAQPQDQVPLNVVPSDEPSSDNTLWYPSDDDDFTFSPV
ncbi:hypothetical protein PTSG_06638 [Salpingoeca rosetta]|uniref:Uncharacterized protein n=1 Tax=Salpingoeca rosetta (strain ATCC 50818 / BSB-021) TaxID=946362 RepID=F2UFK1_SALR5|nr:uncharacterized protein PTSG_06638 [Salpingoeca rosetta]EGD75569.1 hypothetical protein PTSG_06638 [Salpingoeca rosetta]|eukprot:XP_004992026.1 hypothetical protein PTSG_06638 [Salpingoeca rosetta]